MQKPRLLVVEDEPAFARLIHLALSREGFDVHAVTNGEDALDLAAEIHPDAVILDLGLPGADGLSILDDLREWSDLPVVVVGAQTTESIRRGLDRGADDYVTKPFAPAELAARVRAVLRRRHHSRGRTHVIGAWVVDLDARTLAPAGGSGQPVPHAIGRGGWRLLEKLLDNPGRILYRDELLDAAFGPGYRGDSGFLQEQIRRLRRALGIPAWDEGPIRTIHGVGYAYDQAGEIPAGRPRKPRPKDADDAEHADTRSDESNDRLVGSRA
ncbi:MAG TPA: response regulator transcription factor [Candidatus Limnocylindrales bacterium]|nr:response regulator transcription factor [Candidatus Limnocylindrales bacterium]